MNNEIYFLHELTCPKVGNTQMTELKLNNQHKLLDQIYKDLSLQEAITSF